MTSSIRIVFVLLLVIGCLNGPSQAAEVWPAQPYDPSDILLRGQPVWPGYRAAARSSGDVYRVQPGILYVRPSVKRGGLLASWPGLFFHSRQDLDLFEGPSNAIGDGFARWPRGSWEKSPEWMELFHDASGAACEGGALKRHDIRPDHQSFRRPHWPKVRSAHEIERIERLERIKLQPHRSRIRLDRDF